MAAWYSAIGPMSRCQTQSAPNFPLNSAPELRRERTDLLDSINTARLPGNGGSIISRRGTILVDNPPDYASSSRVIKLLHQPHDPGHYLHLFLGFRLGHRTITSFDRPDIQVVVRSRACIPYATSGMDTKWAYRN
jgi:hypothetical protein